MPRHIPGLHHVTAISGPPQRNVDFYTGTLAQRLVKKTVNFDDPGTYHLYYGDRAGSPGTILTFFPFANAGAGRAGPGMASAYAYAVPAGGFDAWVERLAGSGAVTEGPTERFGARVLTVRDPDGAPVELVETGRDSEEPLDGFHSVTLWVNDIAPTARLLTDVFGYAEQDSETAGGGERLRLVVPGGARAAVVDVMRRDDARPGRPGAGTIHHVAFRAETREAHAAWREAVRSAGFDVTPVIDRQYFDAIYFREPGGILFEIATDPPGFARDEPVEHLGEKLMLPERYEGMRSQIEAHLPPLEVTA